MKLVSEFGGTLTDEEVPVRSFVMTLDNRRARAILKERSAAPA